MNLLCSDCRGITWELEVMETEGGLLLITTCANCKGFTVWPVASLPPGAMQGSPS